MDIESKQCWAIIHQVHKHHPSILHSNFWTVLYKQRAIGKQSNCPNETMVEITGLEPVTSWLPVKHSPSWAIPPHIQKKSNPRMKSYGGMHGASDGTWTRTSWNTRPSNVPVCQFQHTLLCRSTYNIIACFSGFVKYFFAFIINFFPDFFAFVLWILFRHLGWECRISLPHHLVMMERFFYSYRASVFLSFYTIERQSSHRML